VSFPEKQFKEEFNKISEILYSRTKANMNSGFWARWGFARGLLEAERQHHKDYRAGFDKAKKDVEARDAMLEEWLRDEQKLIQKEADEITGNDFRAEKQLAFWSGRLHEVFEIRKRLEERLK